MESMREHVSIANSLSSASLAAGFLSLIAAWEGSFGLAVALIGFAALFDAIDGPVARRRGTTSAFGEDLDSLADMVSFAVAPAFALYCAGLRELAVVGLAACILFVVCAAWRLARFSLIKDRHAFVGCPAPVAALAVAPLAAIQPHAFGTLAAVLGMSLLMVGTVRVPTFAGLRHALVRRGVVDVRTVNDALPPLLEPPLGHGTAHSR